MTEISFSVVRMYVGTEYIPTSIDSKLRYTNKPIGK